MTRMEFGLDDNSKVTIRANHLVEGEDLIDVLDTNFLAALELVDQHDDPLVQTVLPDGVVLNELRKYIEPAIIVEHRNIKHDMTPDQLKRILYPMRICTKEDFTSKDFHVSKEFEQQLKYRLCPDIP